MGGRWQLWHRWQVVRAPSSPRFADVPTRPNKVVTIDFIVKLPKSKDPIIDVSYNLALVLVDRLTKFVTDSVNL